MKLLPRTNITTQNTTPAAIEQRPKPKPVYLASTNNETTNDWAGSKASPNHPRVLPCLLAMMLKNAVGPADAIVKQEQAGV